MKHGNTVIRDPSTHGNRSTSLTRLQVLPEVAPLLQRLKGVIELAGLGEAARDVVHGHLVHLRGGLEVIAHEVLGLERGNFLEDNQGVVVVLLVVERDGLVEHVESLNLELLLLGVVLHLHLLGARAVVAARALRLHGAALLGLLKRGDVAVHLLHLEVITILILNKLTKLPLISNLRPNLN